MEITDFITKNFISSFAGALVAVELIVFITKNFPLIKKIPTKFYTFILAIIHLIIIKIFGGNIEINIQEIYILFINSEIDACLSSSVTSSINVLNSKIRASFSFAFFSFETISIRFIFLIKYSKKSIFDNSLNLCSNSS